MTDGARLARNKEGKEREGKKGRDTEGEKGADFSQKRGMQMPKTSALNGMDRCSNSSMAGLTRKIKRDD